MVHWPRTGCSVLVAENNKVLLIKRGKNPYKGYWSLPGGGQEIGETLQECAIRELFEETNLVANTIRFGCVRDRIQRLDNGEIAHHFVLTTFVVDHCEGELIAKDDAEECRWYSLTEIARLQTTPDLLPLIKDLI